MMFIKKLIMGIAAFFLILWGGAGTQSNNMLLQGGGFIGLIIGLVVLYIFAKMAWRAMGCLPSFLVISAIIIFILYAIGAFSQGIGGVGTMLKSFLGQGSAPQAQQVRRTQAAGALQLLDEQDFEAEIGEGFETEEMYYVEENAVAPQPREAAPQPQPQQAPQTGTFGQLINSLTGSGEAVSAPMNPENFPAIYEPARVINGDTLMIAGRYFRLFGIDAPESNQTCADRNGRAYHCGRKAATWLRDWIQDYPLTCHIMQQDSKGNMVGTCKLGEYDLGAALVNADWAVAYPKYSQVYVPYEYQARENLRGLWQGQFYKPWDWRVMQTKKPKIKITRPKKAKKNLLD